MKFLTFKFRINEQSKIWLLVIGLFVLLPGSLYYLSEFLTSFFGKNGCLISSGGLFWLHVGLLLIIPLISIASWRSVITIGLLFLGLSSMYIFVTKNLVTIGKSYDVIGVALFYNTYNSIYLFGIKGCIEAWKRRKTKSFFWAIFLTSPLLIVLGLTAFVGFFFVINCFPD